MDAFFNLFYQALSDRDERPPLPSGFTDDASHLNQTRIAEIVALSQQGASVEDQLRTQVQRAQVRKLPLSIAGTRHTMGGQTFTSGGIVLNMLGLRQMHLDEHKALLRVQAGACWSEVLRYLHHHRRSLQVMQSNNSFSVGGSLGANCHGWQPESPPIASTVRAFRLLLADGTIKKCSREENAELFSLALGGYGLFGILIDADLDTCANVNYAVTSRVLQSQEYPAFYQQHIQNEREIGLAYGRFNVDPQHLLKEILLTTYHSVSDALFSPLGKPGQASIRRVIFRASIGSASGKALRWNLEKQFGTMAVGQTLSRNTLLNEGIEVFANRSTATTDILQEYFVPAGQLESFLEQARTIIAAHQVDLLNVTIRFVRADHDSFLRYADQDLFALVMLFHLPRTWQADQRMAVMSHELIQAAMNSGGRYYLPYRLHATRNQFARCYPQAQQFFELKRKYDPEALFQNQFYLTYGD